MSIISYNVEVVNNTKEIRNIVANTMTLYNEALNYVVDVVKKHFLEIKNLESLNQRMYIEHLIHNTKNNVAIYDFDNKFYKLPCYLLRDILARAIGHVSSYYSNLENYNKEKYERISNGMKFKKKEPTLGVCNSLPTFYKNNMYIKEKDNIYYFKMFVDNTWKYIKLKLKKRDLKYINKM